MDAVGSAGFRKFCVADIIDSGWYQDHSNFFERYLHGEDFDYAKLKGIGYKPYEARNLNAYINNFHNSYYKNALGWE